jgi:arylsulfatase A-like enzyme
MKPNVILIIADQMRGDCVGADGNPVVQTPNLDFLANHGALFRHAYSAVPSCLPARAILMTGQDQWHTGVLGMGPGSGAIPNDFPHTLAGCFSGAGYQTHLVGKGHFHPQRASMGFESAELDESGRMADSEYRRWFASQVPPDVTPDDHGVGFNSWHARPWHTEERLHPSAWTMARSLAFLRGRDRARPFFLNISFARPHSPYCPPPYYFNLYAQGRTPPPFVGDWDAHYDNPHDAANTDAWRGRMTPEQIHRARSGYYGDVSFIDTQIGRLLNELARLDRETYSNTWFIVTSDHGDMLGDHHLWRKTYAYEGSARIPFIVKPPANRPLPKRGRPDEAVELRDIMPTLLEAAGIPVPATVEGSSVLPLLDAPAPDWRPFVHGEHCVCYSIENEMQYVTDGRRKYIWHCATGREEFFDLENDPGECRNLIAAPERAGEVGLWRGRLVERLDARQCGWVKDGKPHRPDTKPLESPWRYRRWPGKQDA